MEKTHRGSREREGEEDYKEFSGERGRRREGRRRGPRWGGNKFSDGELGSWGAEAGEEAERRGGMAEGRGLVKLFGKTILVPAEDDVAVVGEPGGGGGDGDGEEASKTLPDHSSTAEAQQEDEASLSSEEKSGQQTSSSTGSENHKDIPTDRETQPDQKDSKPVEEHNGTSTNQPEEAIKKPDKILPCPRCNSRETKFCYYNNYNANQPRHFCKNCQRYWTAGGTMRNVPVGAGRRKNKHSASHYRYIAVAKAALHPVRPTITELVHHTEPKSNDMPLCESMASALKLAERTQHGHVNKGFYRPDQEHAAPLSCANGGVENSGDRSSGSSLTTSNSDRDGAGANTRELGAQDPQAYAPQFPCFNGTPWPYPWSTAAPPTLCASSFPISFYPMTPFWGCTVPSTAWSVPWLAPLSSFPPSSGSAWSAPNSPTLGKHSRDGDALITQSSSEQGDASVLKNSSGERCLWIPKTLRIDDLEEVAKSSIWATMGFKNDKADGISRGGLFGDFSQPTAEISARTVETSSQTLHANPAALSRSLNFHESS